MSELVKYVELKKIQPNRLNPRLEISITGINELTDSIKEVGLLQPLIVRPKGEGYEVVVGERRYRASQQAGLEKVPVIIRDYADDEVIELNLIENIQRKDLSAVEKGNCFKQLMEKHPKKYPTLEKLAKKLGVGSVTISSWLELVRAPEEVQRLIAPVQKVGVPRPKGKLDYDTAVTIVHKVREPERQIEVAREIAKRPIYRRMARQIVKEVAEEPLKPVQEVIKKVVEAPYQMPFRLNHMEPILKGVKTQTSRKGIPDPKVKVGAIVHASIWEPHFADLIITSIERKKLGEFTEEDAKREGGYTLDEFKEAWESIHGEGSWNPDEVVNVIHFKKK